MGRWKNGCTYFFLCNPNHQIYLDLMLKEKEDKHTTIRGKGKNPEVEKVTKKRSQCKFNTFSLRTKSHMRYIVYSIYRIYDISHMRYGKPFSSIKNLKFNIAYAI